MSRAALCVGASIAILAVVSTLHAGASAPVGVPCASARRYSGSPMPFIRSAHLRLNNSGWSGALRPDRLSAHRVLVDGAAARGLIDSTWITQGCLSDGRHVAIVPVISDGSGGVFETLLFVGPDDAPHYVATLRGVSPGHLRVSVENGYIVERSPQDSWANCCWNHESVRRSRLVGNRVVPYDVTIRPAPWFSPKAAPTRRR